MDPLHTIKDALQAAENVLILATARIVRLEEALHECAEYFDTRADADHDDTGFVPNVEMRLLQIIQQALGEH